MELKGVKPGRFHPRCTTCRGKFVLQISTDPNEPPMVGAEHDPSAETISPVIAHALGVEATQAAMAQSARTEPARMQPAMTQPAMTQPAMTQPTREAPVARSVMATRANTAVTM